MKKLIILIFIFASAKFYSQAPLLISYQGIARDASGIPLVNHLFNGIEFKIRLATPNGLAVFTETHTAVNTNASGIFTCQIGAVSNNLGVVPWGTAKFYLEVRLNDGAGFMNIGPPQELISVPYALYAANVKTYTPGQNIMINAAGVISSPSYSINYLGNGLLRIDNGLNIDTALIPQVNLVAGVGINIIPGVNSYTISTIGSSNFWSLTGNTNINPALNFIGTTDMKNLIFKTNGNQNMVITYTNGNVGIGSLAPGYKLDVLETVNTNAAILGNNTSITSSSAAHGISGSTSNNSNLAAGVFGISTGAGPGVYGSTNGAGPAIYAFKSTPGIGGKFEVFNNSDAVLASITGSGAAVHAQAGVAPTSTLSLWVENGHIKSTGGPPSYTVNFNNTGWSAFIMPNSGNTDVRGVLTFTTNSAGTAVGNYYEITTTFNKSYSVPPVVSVTQFDLSKFSYQIVSVATTNFVVRIVNNTSLSQIPPAGIHRFTYMIIE